MRSRLRELPSPADARTTPILRPYQLSAIAAVRDRFSAGDKRTLLVLPTGTGKTVVFAELAREVVARGERVLVLAHRTELLEQAQQKLADVGCHSRLEKASSHAGAAQVVVASTATLRGERLKHFPARGFGLVVVDEGHHAVAESYKAILEAFADVPTLLVTATPDRADGKGLVEVCPSVAYQYDLRQAIRDRWLVPLVARRITVKGLDLSSVKTRAGDLDAKELGEIMRAEEHLHAVVDPLRREAGDRKTMVFAVDVAHAHAIADLLNRHEPGCALGVDGSASDLERKAALSLFKRGVIRFLVNCALFTEGFDEPSVQCIAVARPTKSRALHTQMIGRGTRLFAGKRDCLILDFVGNSGRHRLVGPLDVLAGNAELAAQVREEAERRLGDGQGELEDVIAQAEAEVAKKNAKVGLVALAQYRTSEIDLFVGELPPMRNAKWVNEPATATQLELIEKAKLGRPPVGISRGEAAQILDALKVRREAGLATVPMCRLLERLHMNTKGMSFARAGELLGRARAVGWSPRTFAGEPEFRGRSR